MSTPFPLSDSPDGARHADDAGRGSTGTARRSPDSTRRRVTGSAVSRRTVLAGLLAGAAAVPAVALAPGLLAPAAAAGLPQVPLLDPGLPSRSAFAPAEQRLAVLLRNIAPIANGISEDPATYGWLRGGWGGRSPDAPFNARIQENVLTLSWFHANARSWNPYSGSEALLARLDAALGYYLGLQDAGGWWTEYSPTERSRAATAFGLSFLSGTVRQLGATGSLPATRERALGALDRAARWFLDPANADVYTTPRQQYTNQVAAGLIGVVEARKAGAAAGLDAQLAERIGHLRSTGQSPAGYFYEPLGQDIGYSFEVMMPDLAKLWSDTRNADVLAMADGYYDWLGWNMLREPDGSGYLTNVASCARTQMVFLDDATDDTYKAVSNSLFCPDLPRAAAFTPTTTDRERQRAAWAASPDEVKPLSPYFTVPSIVRDQEYGEALPDEARKQAAVAGLPYLRTQLATELRQDPLGGTQGRQWVYVRRPGVYLGAHFGNRASDLVRTGPAFLWTPEAGTLVHALNNRDDSAWCTRMAADGRIDTRQDLDVTWFRGDPAHGRVVGDPRQVPGAAPLGMRWSTFGGALTKDLVVTADTVSWLTRATGAAEEQVPLVLRPDDVVRFDDGTAVPFGGSVTTRATGLDIVRGGRLLTVRWDTPVTAAVEARAQLYFRARSRRLHALLLPHSGRLTVTVTTR